MRLRKRNPEACPAEIIATLERHYVTAITIAGGVVTAGTIAMNVGIALIPGVAAGEEQARDLRWPRKGAARNGRCQGCPQPPPPSQPLREPRWALQRPAQNERCNCSQPVMSSSIRDHGCLCSRNRRGPQLVARPGAGARARLRLVKRKGQPAADRRNGNRSGSRLTSSSWCWADDRLGARRLVRLGEPLRRHASWRRHSRLGPHCPDGAVGDRPFCLERQAAAERGRVRRWCARRRRDPVPGS